MAVELSWNFRETATNIANNSSTVKLDIYITTSGESYNMNTQWGTVWWRGQHSTGGYTLPANTTTLVHSETQEIPHDSDGSGSTTFACAIPTTSAGGTKESGNITIQLTKLPRASGITGFYGNDCTGNFNATFTPLTGNYAYMLRISIPNVVMLQKFENYTSGQNVKLSNSAIEELQKRMPNTNTVTLGGVIETYETNQGTQIGESTELMNLCTFYRGRIKVSDSWKKAVPYIKVDGTWKQAIPYEKVNGTWKSGV